MLPLVHQSYHHQALTTGEDSCQIFVVSSAPIQDEDDVWPQGAYVLFEENSCFTPT